MNLLDLTLPTPAENLAADEALLDAAEAGGAGEMLRFWESPENFVVVGYANKVADEVDVAACEAHNIPILRRCSGGGTVLQGPGCLNYALILKIEPTNALQNISLANQFIMARNRTALQTFLKRPVRIQGHTDLTMGAPASLPAGFKNKLQPAGKDAGAPSHLGLKFSGNAQRRRKKFLLFHGTFLLHFDLALVSRLLRFPSKQPDYRASRLHGDFLTNLETPSDAVKNALAAAWCPSGTGVSPVRFESNGRDARATITALARDKYATREWSFKF